MTATADPVACARSFVHAVVWGEHTTVWDLLSDDGRATVLSVAVSNGLDRVVAGRMRDGLADPADREAFLSDLLAGLRRDFRSVELAAIDVATQTTPSTEGKVSVSLVAPSQIPGTGPWPAGRIWLSHDDDRGWRVDRLEPRLVTP